MSAVLWDLANAEVDLVLAEDVASLPHGPARARLARDLWAPGWQTVFNTPGAARTGSVTESTWRGLSPWVWVIGAIVLVLLLSGGRR